MLYRSVRARPLASFTLTQYSSSAHAFKAPYIMCVCVSPSLSTISLFTFKERISFSTSRFAATPHEHLFFFAMTAMPELEHLSEQSPKTAATRSADFLVARAGAPVEGNRGA